MGWVRGGCSPWLWCWGCWGVCEASWKGWRQDFLQQRLLLGLEEGTVWGGEAQLPMGWACFTHLTTQRWLLVCSHPPQPAGSRSALGPQLCWDGAVPGGLSQIRPRARSWTRHMPGEHPHSLAMGTAAQGGDLAEGLETSLCFFPSFLLLQGLVGMSPVKTWAHITLASPSPFPLLAACHLLVSVPIMSLCSLSPSLWHCLSPISL